MWIGDVADQMLHRGRPWRNVCLPSLPRPPPSGPPPSIIDFSFKSAERRLFKFLLRPSLSLSLPSLPLSFSVRRLEFHVTVVLQKLAAYFELCILVARGEVVLVVALDDARQEGSEVAWGGRLGHP